MSNAEKIIALFVGVGMVTTLVLPGRMTGQVIGATAGGLSTFLGTAMALPKYAG